MWQKASQGTGLDAEPRWELKIRLCVHAQQHKLPHVSVCGNLEGYGSDTIGKCAYWRPGLARSRRHRSGYTMLDLTVGELYGKFTEEGAMHHAGKARAE